VFVLLFLSAEQLNVQIAFLVFTLAAITDWYDGWYARRYGFATKWGRFLDPLADKILTSAAFLSMYILNERDPAYFGQNEIIPVWILVLIIISRDLLLTVFRSLKEFRGFAFVTSKIAKLKTFLQMTFIFMFTGFLFIGYSFESLMPVVTTFLYSDFCYWFLLVVSLFTLVTGIMYFFESGELPEKIPSRSEESVSQDSIV
jgi:CDP-diacylglycerol--glycerol-3-phosphate 3-phosphatidyltransferase